MTAVEWRRRERELREHAKRQSIRLPIAPGMARGMEVTLQFDSGVGVHGATYTTDEGAMMLRDWLLEKFPIKVDG